MIYSRIRGTGSYLPVKVLTNADLVNMVDTTEEWIVERTGIRERHIAADKETTCDLAEQAARRAIEAAGISHRDIDLIIVATTTPDRVFPSTACLLQDRLDIHGCAAFDVQAVCTGLFTHWVLPTSSCAAAAQTRAGGRRRDPVAHCRLDRPRHLRAVR